MKMNQCLTCQRMVRLSDDETEPLCCGEKMKESPQEICLQPSHPEHARAMQNDTPCDDGRGNLKYH